MQEWPNLALEKPGERRTPEEQRALAARNRPGCITSYVLLSALGLACVWTVYVPAFSTTLAKISQNTAYANDPEILALANNIFVGAVVVGSLLTLAQMWGLWKMRAWGRWLAILFNGLAIVGSLCSLVGLTSGAYPVAAAGGGSAGVEILVLFGTIGGLAYIVYWFASHGDRFV